MIQGLRVAIVIVGIVTSIAACSGESLKDNKVNVRTNGTIVIATDAVHLTKTNDKRTLRIYLPPSYETATSKRYPVLYMHDAQNLFDDATSFVGEWGVDESLDAVYQENGFEIIVVGIDNHSHRRLNEYSAWDNEKYGEGNADDFVVDIVNVVKPYIDNTYRTKSDRANTAMMGSSLGGLLTHYAVAQYPNVFSKAGVFSPSYWYAPAVYDFTANANIPKEHRWYFLAGDQEGGDMVNKMNQMVEQIFLAGDEAPQIHVNVIAGGKHNEHLWKTNFKGAIQFLFELN